MTYFLFTEGLSGGGCLPREEVVEAATLAVTSVAEEAMANCSNDNTIIDFCSLWCCRKGARNFHLWAIGQSGQDRDFVWEKRWKV
jgi:hypothetical protein